MCIRLPDSLTMKRGFLVSLFFFSEKAHIPRTFRVKRDTSVKGGHSGFIVNSAKQVSTVGFLMFKVITLTNFLTFMPIASSAL